VTLRAPYPYFGGKSRAAHLIWDRFGDVANYVEPFALQKFAMWLQVRMRHVRVCCGDWSRVTGDSVTWRHGLTGVLLDPPYQDGNMEYVAGHGNVSQDVAKWAIANGDNPLMRIALCGYEGEHVMPASWECVPWKAKGGYGGQSKDHDNPNAKRERIWFSPHCLGGKQRSLF